jgi:hypothetical protein
MILRRTWVTGTGQQVQFVGDSGNPTMMAAVVSGVIDGSNKLFTLTPAPATDAMIFLDGLLLSEADYARVGATVTLSMAPQAGATLAAYVY